MTFSPDQLAEVRRLQRLYPDRRGALLPVLHMAQETFGHISLEAEAYVAVCRNLSCHLAGAPEILAHVKARLGIDPGETTEDGRITFQSVECLCACEAAPMAQVDDRYEVNLTPEKVDRILEALR
jgi:NADH:ubiquinone oxidoreductase subunit E